MTLRCGMVQSCTHSAERAKRPSASAGGEGGGVPFRHHRVHGRGRALPEHLSGVAVPLGLVVGCSWRGLRWRSPKTEGGGVPLEGDQHCRAHHQNFQLEPPLSPPSKDVVMPPKSISTAPFLPPQSPPGATYRAESPPPTAPGTPSVTLVEPVPLDPLEAMRHVWQAMSGTSVTFRGG